MLYKDTKLRLIWAQLDPDWTTVNEELSHKVKLLGENRIKRASKIALLLSENLAESTLGCLNPELRKIIAYRGCKICLKIEMAFSINRNSEF